MIHIGNFIHPGSLEEESRTEEERRSKNVPPFSGASPEGVCCQKLSSAAALQCQKPARVDNSQDGGEVDNVAHTPWLSRW